MTAKVKAMNRRASGDQHVEVVVEVPTNLSSREEELIKELAAIQDEKVGSGSSFLKDFWNRMTS